MRSGGGLEPTVRSVRVSAPGVGTGGDAGVDGGDEEWLEIVGGFDVEGGILFVAARQSLPFEGAGCTGGDGVEQALEFGLGRCGDTVDTGRFVIERTGAVEEAHVQVRVEVQRRAEALDEGVTQASRQPPR